MAKKSLKKGVFITFEGPEGCGKSTQSKLLYDFLKQKGHGCVYTREPGGTKLGETIRQILLHVDGIKISDLAELFLFEAARAEIINEIILPSLEKEKIVICDRFSDATVAYQGYGGKIPLKTINALNSIATNGLKPNLTVVLDVDTLIGLKRASKKGVDRMEKKDTAYHRRVRSGYLAMARKESGRIKVVKVDKNKFVTQEKIRELALYVISRYKRQ